MPFLAVRASGFSEALRCTISAAPSCVGCEAARYGIVADSSFLYTFDYGTDSRCLVFAAIGMRKGHIRQSFSVPWDTLM